MARRPFTADDDKALARYLAEYNASKSGRSGRRIYEQIEKQAAELGSWASAHSAQSWQTRYRDQQGRIDLLINRYQNNHNIEPTAPQRLLDQDPSRKRARASEQDSSQPVAAKRPRVEGPSQETSQGLNTSHDSWSKPLPVEKDIVKDEQPSLWDISLQSQAPVQSQAPPTPPRTNSVKSLRDSSASPNPRTRDSIPCAQPMPRLTPTSQVPPHPYARDTSLPPSDAPESDSDNSSPKRKRYPRQYEESPFGRALMASNGKRRISAGGHRATGVEERDLRKGSSPTKSWPPKRSSARRKNIEPDLDNSTYVPHPRVPPAAAVPRRPQVNAVASSSKVKLPDAARLSPRTARRILPSNFERAPSPPPRPPPPPTRRAASPPPLRRASTPIMSPSYARQSEQVATPPLVPRVRPDDEESDAASERPPPRADKRKRHMPPPPATRSHDDDEEEVNVPTAPKGKHARRSNAIEPVSRTHKRRQTFASFGKDARSDIEVVRPRKSLQIEKRRKSMFELEPASQSYLSQLRRSGIISPRPRSSNSNSNGNGIYLSVGRMIVRRDLGKKYGFEGDVVENVLEGVGDEPEEAERVLREMREAAKRAYRRRDRGR
ncbi:hypothetical protein PENSPDRAFT_328264 [Peniophora sp. CONT]|nr:hypothetical protein PENSPDRAFT_328264 [Peniophora sp. CONT]